ncbi:uncharacterized protein Sfp53D [Drosophila takahashii]|uniref:uncharacterized protein Sfp53D n=1 Tax=Drosophila takahashii TaxID=29030 RepID=UPI001CF85D52|nr:uncharacterized protein LOC108054297 [Drosophila takahashii]
MKLFILLALFCQILLSSASFDHDHAYRKCNGIVYLSCKDYCDRGCKNNVPDCLHRCFKGCGCVAASILRNNGGCKRIVQCEKNEKDSVSLENQDYSGQYVTAWWVSSEEEHGHSDEIVKKANEHSHSEEIHKKENEHSHSEERLDDDHHLNAFADDDDNAVHEDSHDHLY